MGGEFGGECSVCVHVCVYMYMYMYGWVPSLFTWNYYNAVNQLYPGIKFKKKLKREQTCLLSKDLNMQPKHWLSESSSSTSERP